MYGHSSLTPRIVERAGFGRITTNDAAVIGEAYWGNIPDGTPVNMDIVTKSIQDKFAKQAPGVMVPLQGPVFDKVYRDFIFAPTHLMEKSDFNEYAIKAREKIDKYTTSYLDQIG